MADPRRLVGTILPNDNHDCTRRNPGSERGNPIQRNNRQLESSERLVPRGKPHRLGGLGRPGRRSKSFAHHPDVSAPVLAGGGAPQNLSPLVWEPLTFHPMTPLAPNALPHAPTIA